MAPRTRESCSSKEARTFAGTCSFSRQYARRERKASQVPAGPMFLLCEVATSPNPPMSPSRRARMSPGAPSCPQELILRVSVAVTPKGLAFCCHPPLQPFVEPPQPVTACSCWHFLIPLRWGSTPGARSPLIPSPWSSEAARETLAQEPDTMDLAPVTGLQAALFCQQLPFDELSIPLHVPSGHSDLSPSAVCLQDHPLPHARGHSWHVPPGCLLLLSYSPRSPSPPFHTHQPTWEQRLELLLATVPPPLPGHPTRTAASWRTQLLYFVGQNQPSSLPLLHLATSSTSGMTCRASL